MAVAKMKKFEVIGHKQNLDSISYQMIKNKYMQPLDYKNFNSSDLLTKELKPFVKQNPYTKLLERIKEIFTELNLNYTLDSVPSLNDIEQRSSDSIAEELQPISDKVERIVEFRERINKEKNRLEDLKKHIWLMRNLDIDLDELKRLSHISLIFGRVAPDNFTRLIKNIADLPILILEVYREEGNVWFFSFAKKEYEERALKLLNSVYFDRIELPARVRGRPVDILERIEHRLKSIDIAYKEIDLKLRAYRHLYKNRLKELYRQVKLLNKIREISNRYSGQSPYLFILNGWIPEYKENEFISKLEKDFPDVIYTSQDADSVEEEPPTILKNNSWLKPFESLLELYGIPRYGEIDPSFFIAITYLLMFGMMFGDVGQGLVFVLVGLLIYRGYFEFLSTEAGQLLAYLGVSSMFFGLLYGSVFGLEHILPALWIRPLDNIMYFLQLTIGLGIVLMLVGMGFNLINSFKNGELEEGVLSRNGLTGIFFYTLSLLIIYFLITKGKLLFDFWLTIFLLTIPLLLIFFKKPIMNLINKRKVWPENLQEYFLESGFELFDTLISFLSNTISFVRIGAFTLNHIGLFMAVFTLARMLREATGQVIWSSLIIIGGNLLIMILEGLVVGIQVLRLEYFELFGRFYKGDGKRFWPIRLK